MSDGCKGICGSGGKQWRATTGFMIMLREAVGLVRGGGSLAPGSRKLIAEYGTGSVANTQSMCNCV